MQEAPVRGSNPQTTIAIPEHTQGLEWLRPGTWKRVRFGLPVNELSDSALRRDQECAVIALIHSLGGRADHRVWHRIEFRRTRFPSPQPSLRSRPEIASAILIQR